MVNEVGGPGYHYIIVHHHKYVIVVVADVDWILYTIDIVDYELYEVDTGAVGVEVGTSEARVDFGEIVFAIFDEEVHVERAVELEGVAHFLDKGEKLGVFEGNGLAGTAYAGFDFALGECSHGPVRDGVDIDVGVAVTAGHKFLDYVVVLAAVPVGLGLFEGVHLMGAYAAAAAYGFHEYREGNFASVKGGSELVPVVECQGRAYAFFTAVFEKFVFIEAINRALFGRTQWYDTNLAEAVAVGGKYFYFRVNQSCHGLDAVAAAYIEYGVDIGGVGDAGHYILAVAELQGRGSGLQVGAHKHTGFAQCFFYIAQQTPAASHAAE